MAVSDICVRADKLRDYLVKLPTETASASGDSNGVKRWRLAYRSNGKQKLLQAS